MRTVRLFWLVWQLLESHWQGGGLGEANSPSWEKWSKLCWSLSLSLSSPKVPSSATQLVPCCPLSLDRSEPDSEPVQDSSSVV